MLALLKPFLCRARPAQFRFLPILTRCCQPSGGKWRRISARPFRRQASMSADLLRRLIEGGTPVALIAEVAQALGEAAANQRNLDRRRAADAARQRARRDREKEAASCDATLGQVP
ncbi:hypothetical protein [Sphingomonas crocodyli]|uniref:Uncharacterized protein n=1 Tax=Sphingomonas crocodyli TaxID=1979270 RepID=A0A437LXQ4_9SPHN|nr:hypothetical protein [Sphingomonas crocodyli]RVT90136.1 hypothetical protein EOD43_17665 [Sphingomonas crocodyli]